MMYLNSGMATAITKPYVLQEEEAGIFISFDTAQEAFDWTAKHSPNDIIQVDIQPKLVTITNYATQSR